MGKNKIHLTENGNLIKTDLDTAEIPNDFFSNIMQKLDIRRSSNNKAILDNIKDLAMKAILSIHPNIKAIRN